MKTAKILPVIVALWLVQACTAGRATYNGQPIASGTVIFHTCSRDYQTTTDANGQWSFNPFSPDSAVIDEAKHIPEGPGLIEVRRPNMSSGDTQLVDHHYTGTCSVTFNSQVSSEPCALYRADFASFGSEAKYQAAQLKNWNAFKEKCIPYATDVLNVCPEGTQDVNGTCRGPCSIIEPIGFCLDGFQCNNGYCLWPDCASKGC